MFYQNKKTNPILQAKKTEKEKHPEKNAKEKNTKPTNDKDIKNQKANWISEGGQE
jgi:hypothetical protein